MDEALLKPAMQMATELRLPVPNESEEYARAREALLASEIELRDGNMNAWRNNAARCRLVRR